MTSPKGTRRRLALAAWTLLVAVLLVAPGEELPDPGVWDWLDKPVHALLFAVHCGLLAGWLAVARPDRGPAAAAAVSGLYAALLEAVQLWVPGRSWEWWDLGAGLAGIAVAALGIARHRARLRAAA